VAAASAFGASKLVASVAPDDPRDGLARSPGISSPDSVDGDSGESLLKRKNFQRVIDTLREEGGSEGQISTLRLAPGQASVSLRGKGKTQQLAIGPGGKIQFRAALPAQAVSSSRFGVTRLNAKVPQRIASAIREKSGADVDAIDYMVAHENPIDGKLGWQTFLDDDQHTHWSANGEGRDVHRPGAQSAGGGSPPAVRTLRGKEAEKVLECVAKAGNEPAKVQACIQ